MLLDRRAAALAAYPNSTDPRHGMPTGNDEVRHGEGSNSRGA